jgi:hypothetical protein
VWLRVWARVVRIVEMHVIQMLARPTTLEDWTAFLGDIYAHCVLTVHSPERRAARGRIRLKH